MPRENPFRPFTPDPAQMALEPGVSGNTINGLGEPGFRRARMVYWAPDPDDIPHGGMQRYFYSVPPDTPELRTRQAEIRARRQDVLDAPLPPVARHRVARAPADWTAALDRFVQDRLCDRVGVAEMNPDWVFEGHEIAERRVIVLGVQHAYEPLSEAPGPAAGVEVLYQYMRAAAAAKQIAGWLHAQGWVAKAVTGPMTGSLALIPPALACGFGELGKHGSVINPEFGASFRLSAVLTDAPLAPTPAREFGIDAFCRNCRICEDACPPAALSAEKRMVRGALKWYVDFDRCLPFFNEHQGCAICIAQCPWSRPGVGLNLAAKLAKRAGRLAGD